jgi:5-(carboxyamino)imidazole ribonucleotide mutase
MSEIKPVVGILMGSQSDAEIAKKAMKVLKEFLVPFEVEIISAHRDAERCIQYSKNARKKGLKVIIAMAGMSAHLAGVVAANTMIPVIGVPLSSGALKGFDALLSTVQMPPGIPVATVGVDVPANAAHLAMRILALEDPLLEAKLEQAKESVRLDLLEKTKKIQEDWSYD